MPQCLGSVEAPARDSTPISHVDDRTPQHLDFASLQHRIADTVLRAELCGKHLNRLRNLRASRFRWMLSVTKTTASSS